MAKEQRVIYTGETTDALKNATSYKVIGRQGGDPVVMNEKGKQQRIRVGYYKVDSGTGAAPVAERVQTNEKTETDNTKGGGKNGAEKKG